MKKYEKYLPVITDEDMKLISQPIDFYGQNIYNGRCIRMGKAGRSKATGWFSKDGNQLAGNTGSTLLGTEISV